MFAILACSIGLQSISPIVEQHGAGTSQSLHVAGQAVARLVRFEKQGRRRFRQVLIRRLLWMSLNRGSRHPPPPVPLPGLAPPRSHRRGARIGSEVEMIFSLETAHARRQVSAMATPPIDYVGGRP